MLSTITHQGHLKFLMEPADVDQVVLMHERHGGDEKSFLTDMLDYFGFTPNGKLYAVNAEDIGALTDAPIISNDVDYLEDGRVDVRGEVWWYPAYEFFDMAHMLLRNGEVLFNKAPMTRN